MSRVLALVVLSFLLEAQAGATIARSGSCSAASTTCTLSAVNTGDLKICFAYRSGSRTAPTLPAGWTQIATDATASSGTTGAEISGCSKASSSSDTASGTWTNATDVVCVAYSGTNVNTSADCNSTGITNPDFGNAKASTTISYLGTGTVTDPYGWIVGFAGDSGAVPGVPTGLSSVSTAGAGPAVRVSDSNGVLSTFLQQDVAVVSSTWMTTTMAIYNITAATPTFNKASGNYLASQTITMSSATAGATICYRTDGVAPTASTPGTCDAGSSTYSGSIAANSQIQFLAIATKAGYTNSGTATGSYTFGTANAYSLSSTSPAIDTTGANLIVVACYKYGTSTDTVSDSAGNTWTARSVLASTNSSVIVSYVLNPTTSASHTFTCSAGAQVSVIAFQAPYFGKFAFDNDCSNTSASSAPTSSTFQACSSSITPSSTQDLAVSFLGVNIGANTMTGVDSGFTLIQPVQYIYTSWLLDSNSSPLNPTWTLNFPRAPNIVVGTTLLFKPPARRKRVQVIQ